MRIVYVLTSLGVGGAERQALAVADRMAHRGHEVAILVLSPRLVDEWPTNLPTVYLNMRKTPVSFQAGLVEARRFLRGFPPRPASQPQLSRQHRSSPAQTPGTLHQNCLHCSQHLRRRPAAYVVLPPH